MPSQADPERTDDSCDSKSEQSKTPAPSVRPPSNCNGRVGPCSCRKCSLMSFGDVEPREVHTMIKFIKQNKVASPLFWQHSVHRLGINPLNLLFIYSYSASTIFNDLYNTHKIVWRLSHGTWSKLLNFLFVCLARFLVLWLFKHIINCWSTCWCTQ